MFDIVFTPVTRVIDGYLYRRDKKVAEPIREVIRRTKLSHFPLFLTGGEPCSKCGSPVTLVISPYHHCPDCWLQGFELLRQAVIHRTAESAFRLLAFGWTDEAQQLLDYCAPDWKLRTD